MQIPSKTFPTRTLQAATDITRTGLGSNRSHLTIATPQRETDLPTQSESLKNPSLGNKKHPPRLAVELVLSEIFRPRALLLRDYFCSSRSRIPDRPAPEIPKATASLVSPGSRAELLPQITEVSFAPSRRIQINPSNIRTDGSRQSIKSHLP